jgi:hypothetical protein
VNWTVDAENLQFRLVQKNGAGQSTENLPGDWYSEQEHSTSDISESRMDCLNYGCDMRVSFSLLPHSQDNGASPWDVAAVVLEVVGATTRLMMCLGKGSRKRHSRLVVQHGIRIDGRTIVARTIGKESDPRLSPALILLEAQR